MLKIQGPPGPSTSTSRGSNPASYYYADFFLCDLDGVVENMNRVLRVTLTYDLSPHTLRVCCTPGCRHAGQPVHAADFLSTWEERQEGDDKRVVWLPEDLCRWCFETRYGHKPALPILVVGDRLKVSYTLHNELRQPFLCTDASCATVKPHDPHVTDALDMRWPGRAKELKELVYNIKSQPNLHRSAKK